MRNILMMLMAAAMLLGTIMAPCARAQKVDWGTQRKMLKSQQKLERTTLKTQQQNMRRSWKGQRISSTQR